MFFGLVFILLIVIYNTKDEEEIKIGKDDNQITFSQHASGSLGEYWEYELSSENILEEVKYYKSGLDQIQNWVFKQIGVGELTIRWDLYEKGGRNYNESDSYSITYYFDEDGTYTVLADTREAK